MPLKHRTLTGRNQLPHTVSLDFEVLLRREMRSSGLVLPAPSVAPLFRFWLLRVLVPGNASGLPGCKRSWCYEIIFRSILSFTFSALSPATQVLLSPAEAVSSRTDPLEPFRATFVPNSKS